MRVLVLGAGRQGRAAIYDLVQAGDVEAVTCADRDVDAVESWLKTLASDKLTVVRLDADDSEALRAAMGEGFDVVIDLLPRQFVGPVGAAAVDAGVHLVNTYYDHDLRPLADRARQADVALLPEMGMDPGIDLVLCAEAVRRLDEVHALLSYGGGVPEPSAAAANPLRYKISWTWEGVLNSYARPARILQDGQPSAVAPAELFDERHTHTIDVPELGAMEAFPNGDAVAYVERLGIAGTVRSAGRYALRWPGHCRLWQSLVDLGFLEDAPVPGFPAEISPRQFMIRHLEPRLQYLLHERDVVIVRVQADGVRDRRPRRITLELVDRKDTSSGLTAMSRTVGFSASIAAQMIARGAIAARGLLSPTRDVPYGAFVDELARRSIVVRETEDGPE